MDASMTETLPSMDKFLPILPNPISSDDRSSKNKNDSEAEHIESTDGHESLGETTNGTSSAGQITTAVPIVPIVPHMADDTHMLSDEKAIPKEEANHTDASSALAESHETPNDKEYRDIETIALVVEKPKSDFKLTPIILDEVRGDEILVDMKYSGICHTDIVLQQGLLPMVEFPAIFGHEGAGIIKAIGKDVKNRELEVGDAVLLSFNTCGDCRACNSNHPAFCHRHPQVNHNAVRLGDGSTPARLKNGTSVRSQYFGQSSFAKMSVVNEKCVVKCTDTSKMEIYAPIGCGFQTGAGTVLNVLKPSKEDSIVVFGLGSVGMAALMACKIQNAGIIIAVDIVKQKLSMAKELGATHVINSVEEKSIAKAIKNITNGGATFAIDCTGLLPVIESMIECIGNQGTAALVGVPPPESKIKIDPLTFLLENKKFIGVIEGDSNPPDFIPKLIKLHADGKFPIEKLCKTYPVERLTDAIDDMKNGKVTKPVIDWCSGKEH